MFSVCGDDAPVGVERRERLVDRAVVALVVNEDLRSAGDPPGEADREAVGVGRGHRELPERQAEPAAELLARGEGVLGRKHVGDSAAHLALDGGDRRRWAVTGHRPGVTEAEVDVVVAVDAAEAARRAPPRRRAERATPTRSSSSSGRRRGVTPSPARGGRGIADGRRRSGRPRPTSPARGGRGRRWRPASSSRRGCVSRARAAGRSRTARQPSVRASAGVAADGARRDAGLGSTSRKEVQPLVLQ